MLNRPNKKIQQKSKYFVYRNTQFDQFKLKKNDLLSLFNDDQMIKIETYAKTHKLSYKKEEDVQKMLSHISIN